MLNIDRYNSSGAVQLGQGAIKVCKYLKIRTCRYPLVQMSDTQLNLYVLTRAGLFALVICSLVDYKKIAANNLVVDACRLKIKKESGLSRNYLSSLAWAVCPVLIAN